jgi:hypothetical protein
MGTCRNVAATVLVVLLGACPATVGSDAGGATVPTAPTDVVAVAGNQSVSLSWVAPASTGGSPVTGYSIAINPPAPSAQISVSRNTAMVAPLTSGTAYTFTVAAVNAVGTGPASLPSLAVTPTASAPGVPGAPTNVVAVAGNQSASLTWAAPASTGGSPVTGYSVAISPAASAQVVVSGTSASVTALTNGTAYTFTVAAVNAVGTGPASLPSAAVTPMAPPPGVPTAPSNVTATPGVGSADLSWTAPSSDGGSAITGYTVTLIPPAPSAVVTITATTASVTGLDNGQTYTFTVAAFNANGTGPASSSGPVTILGGVPGAPTNVVAIAGDQAATLSWTAPASSGGSLVSGYVVAIATPAGLSPQVSFSGPTSAVVTSLANGTPYTFTVAAVNAFGTGPASLPSAAVTPAVPTQPPSNLTYSTNPALYNDGTPIPFNLPSSSGGTVASYSVSPPLPAGLSLNPLTGVISGTPTAAAATATYTVTATNVVGSTTASLSITVNMAVPTLVQRRAFGAMVPSRGLTPASYFTIRMQNPIGAGNSIILIMDYSSGLMVSSITDDASNSWSTTPAVSANAGSGLNKTEAYVLQNSHAGARNVTITFSGMENNVHFILLEYYNVGAVGVSTSSTTAKAPTISTSAINPAVGSLVLHYSMDNTALIGESGTAVTSFTAGNGWTLEAGDYASGTSGGSATMSFFVLQTRLAPGGSITPTVTTTGRNTVNSIALELLATSAGSAPPAGIRVLRMQDYLNVSIDVSTWSEPFPSSGNLLAVFDSNGNITSAISDSNSNTWEIPVKGQNSVVCSLNYAANATTGPTLVMSWPITQGGNANTTVTAYDIVGADPVSPYVQSVTSPFSTVGSTFTGQPVITPKKANGVVIVVLGDGIGPITTLNQPAGAYYLSTNYPGEVDNDTIDNADGYALDYYGTNLATQDYGWTLGPGTPDPNSANATGVEFAAPGTGP